MVANENLNISGGGPSKMGPRKSRGPIKALCAIIAAVFLTVGTCACAGTALMQQVAQLHDSQRAPRTGTVFKGEDTDYTFASQDVVTLNLNYRYSNTGGLAGIDAAAPQTVELKFEKQADGTYQATWKLPTVEGFRIVLDATELNKYLVNPPTDGMTADEFAEALESGDFDVDIDHKTVYYYQQESSSDHNLQNPAYSNRYSDEYNKAWNDARWLRVDGADGYYAEAVCGDDATHPGDTSGNHGANALVNPKIKVTLTADQLASARKNELDITVYYRRNATWYLVKHWVPQALCRLTKDEITALPDEDKKQVGTEGYVCLDKDTQQGRVGALTRATARTHTDNENADDNPYKLVQPNAFAQKLIENQTTNNETTVDIFYSAASSYRVIFDTDYTYIPRQQVDLGKEVDFKNVTTPKRTGYTFAGWRYLKKDAGANADGSYNDDQYFNLDPDSPSLTITEERIAQAKLQESGGVLALHLVPKWIPDTTQVRVILWTEDLTGTDDVQALAEGGNAGGDSYYTQKYTNYQEAPVTHKPQLGTTESHYSNAHSFTMNVETDSSLLESGGSGSRALLANIQNQVDNEFRTAMGQASDLDVADFYSQAGFEIVHEDESGINYNATSASSDGKTTIYVYFTRNVYELLFTYYGSALVNNNSSAYCVATATNGYSFSNGAAVSKGNLNYGYTGSHQGYSNRWMRANVHSAANMPVPQTITIRAKYGADLRDVWPVARSAEQVTSLDNDGNKGHVAKMISWGTTAGKYCTDGYPNSGSSHEKEPTIMGTYAAMSTEIVADPARPVTFNANGSVASSGLRHNLVAYWYNGRISYYRNNHCFEIPDLNVSGMQRVSIYNGDTPNTRNFLYLVPMDNPTVAQYDFNDLMPVSYENGQITYDDPDGTYYAVRAYNGKCYAVARRVDTVSSNAINKQNPSARLHMARANTHADHSTRYADGDGAWNGTTCGAETDPYDLYFYYNRDRYTITYMAPSNNITTGSEVTLGTVRLPYGAQVTKDAYGFNLGYKDKNDTMNDDGSNKYGWELKNTDNTAELPSTPVCPDRADNGTKPWTFKGWALGPAGVNMQWTMNEDAGSEAQAGDTFAIESNMRLYAIWDAPSYEVTFHLNGGTIGNSGNDVVESVPANRRYTSTEAIIPRPVRAGYTLKGWYAADQDGNIASPETAFDFDQAIAEDKHVAAKWSANSTETFSYTIYYVTKDPLDGDEDKDTVLVDENGNITSNGGTKYYVLEKSEQKDQAFNPGSTMAFSAKSQTGYVPNGTSKVLELKESGDTYNVIFYYDPIVERQHKVRFVKAGTETGDTPKVIREFTTSPYQTVTTPRPADVEKLIGMGYTLVNKDGNAYISVYDAFNLKWIDEDGKAWPVSVLAGDDVPDVITYLVQPINYTVAYTNADGSPAAADVALNAVTAPKGTSVNDAADDGKNPTQYTAEEGFSVKNPERVWDEETKKWYVFNGWTLGDGTETNPEQEDFPSTNSLIVGAGTVGKLTFIANWRVDDSGTLDGSTSLVVQKSIDGRDWISGDSFSFSLAAKGDVTQLAVDEHEILLPDTTKVTITNETADHQASFGNITFNKAGTYTFAVTEVFSTDNAKIPGIAYDDTVRIVKVKVTSEADGSLTVVRVDENDEPTADPLTFTNTYESKVDYGAAGGLAITKTLNGHDLVRGQFGFTVKPKDEATAQKFRIEQGGEEFTNAQPAPNGDKVVVKRLGGGVEFNQADNGETFSFEVYESRKGGAGYDNDDTRYTVDIAVSDDANTGKLTVITKVSGGATGVKTFTYATGDAPATGAARAEVPFVNEYSATGDLGQDAAVKIEAAKTLSGRDLNAGEFNYVVLDAHGATVAKGSNVAAGKDQPGEIVFTDINYTTAKIEQAIADGTAAKGADGTYRFEYTVAEETTRLPEGVTGSVFTFQIVVVVTDNGDGTLSPEVAYPAGSNSLAFQNTYDTDSVGVEFRGAKWLSLEDEALGLTIADIADKYEFKIEAVTPGAPMPDARVAKNGPAGNVTFGNATYTLADAGKTFAYKVTETGSVAGVANDAAAQSGKTFTVTIADNGDGTLEATTNPADGPMFSFNNTYGTTPASSSLTADGGFAIAKTLTGRPITAGEFEFRLAKLDGTVVASAKNDAGGKVELPAVTFDKPGTYQYVLAEVSGGKKIDGVSYDGSVYPVSAVVTDKLDGTLAVAWSVDGATTTSRIMFANKYAVDTASASIVAGKKLDGRKLAAGEFTFELSYGQGGDAKTVTATNDAAGKVVFDPMTFDAAGEYRFKVREVAGKAEGVTYDKKVYEGTVTVADDGRGSLVAEIAFDNGDEPLFTNTYETSGATFDTDPTAAAVLFNKVLDGRDWLAGDSFGFELTPVDGAPMPEDAVNGAKTVTVTGAGKKDGDQVGFGFGDIAFTDDDMAEATVNADGTRSKTFSYHVKELGVDGRPGTGGLSNGVTYTNKMATLNVKVTDNLEGNLTAAVDGTVENGVFTNTYESKVDYGAAGGLAITKTLNGHDLVRGQFGFTVKPKDEATAQKFRIEQGGEEFTNAQPAPNGDKVVVKRLGGGVEFNQADNGETFSFEVYESRKGGAGYDNDDTRYTVDIAVSDDANTGKLTVITKVSGGATGVKTFTYATGDAPATGAARAEVPFVNEYSATGDLGQDAAVKIEAAKTLSGRDLNAGEFNYVVLDAHGATVAKGSNVAAGKDQPGEIVFTDINYTTAKIEQAIADGTAAKGADGTYRFEYTVAEETTRLPEGVTGSVFTFQIVVVVTDNGDGTLSPEVAYPAGSNSLAFQNTYDTDSVGVEFRGAKWLSLEDEALGLTIADIADKYEFKIEAVTPGAPMPDARVAKNGPAGNVTFGNATYTLADAGKTFAYKVTETGSVAGVANDAAAQSGKTFTVTIADNGDGTLEATTNPADGPMFSFNNTYGTTPASSSLTADGGFAIAKTLTGRPITAGEFEFRLAKLDGTVVASAKNDAGGKVELPAVTFDKPGTYQYVLAEVSGGKKIDGVSYDGSVYPVSAVVTDKLDGTLAVAWSVDGATTTSRIMFANKYAVDTASASIVAGKKLDGRKLAAGEFTFELSYGQGGDAKTVTATNDAAGKVVFDPMTFDAAGEYRFKVREVAGKAEGVTYDKKVYEGTVTVADDGRGSLVAEIAFDNGDEPLFTNVYKKPSSPDAPDNPGGNDGGHDSDGGHDGDGKLVKTGDPFSPMIPGVVAATGALCVIAALVLRKKRR